MSQQPGTACSGGWPGKKFGHKFRWTETVGVICRRCGGRPVERAETVLDLAAHKAAEKI